MSPCHRSNFSGGWDSKAAVLECITISRENVSAWFNEIMTKSHRLAIWLSVRQTMQSHLCRGQWDFCRKILSLWEQGLDRSLKKKERVRSWRLLSLTVQWLPARLQRTQNGAERAELARGWEAHGKRGKVGEMGTIKIAAQRGRAAGETGYRKIMIPIHLGSLLSLGLGFHSALFKPPLKRTRWNSSGAFHWQKSKHSCLFQMITCW